MTEPVDVRVGIVSWNTSALLRVCLEAVPGALRGVNFDVVVVDNASEDDSVAVASSFPFVTVVENDTNVGYARAMNQALAATTAPFLIALNPDTSAPADSLVTLVEDLRRDPALGLAVPRLANDDGSLQHSVHRFPGPLLSLVMGLVPHRWRRGKLGERFWLEGFAAHDRTVTLDDAWAIGAVHVIRRDALGSQLPYREAWFMYTEDMDLCWRLSRDGWGILFDAEVVVPHVGNAAAERVWSPWEREERVLRAGAEWYSETHGRAPARRLALADSVGMALKVAATTVGAAAGSAAAGERLERQRSLARFHVGLLRGGGRR